MAKVLGSCYTKFNLAGNGGYGYKSSSLFHDDRQCCLSGIAAFGLYHVVETMNREHESLRNNMAVYMLIAFSLTLASNLISTGVLHREFGIENSTYLVSLGLLAYRVHQVHRKVARNDSIVQSLIYPVMRTAIDAGVLYTLLLVAAIINQVTSLYPFMVTSIVSRSFLVTSYPLLVPV
jgi:hypothetical protein